jgi:hypothetical protein
MKGARFLALAAGLATLGAGQLAAAENRLVNPELDPPAYVAGWEMRFGAFLDWTGIDADGCPLSGAGQVESATTDVGTQWIDIGQCLPFDVANWSSGVFAGFAYLAADADLAAVGVTYWSDTDCGASGGSLLAMHYQEGSHGPGWRRAENADLAIPNFAGSIYVDLSVEAYQPQGFEALFDRAYAGSAPRIFTDDLEIAGTCRWSASVP